MRLVNRDSLVATLDRVNDAFFYGRPLSAVERKDVAAWIASRRGRPRAYAGMFAPTEHDFRAGAQVFTGEWIRSGAGLAHVFGQEACRALILLDSHQPVVEQALREASAGMVQRLAELESRGYSAGMYCCRRCSVALWRHLAAGGLAHGERRLAAGMGVLRSSRGDNGRWRTFPFYYTLFALNDIKLRSALEELRFAAPALERALTRAPKADSFDQRRRTLAERVLARC